MGKVVVVENVTLDGVMQAPGGADEDTRGDFPYGGWAHPYADQVMAETMGRGMSEDGGMLFGRRTYEHFYGFWSKQTDGNPSPRSSTGSASTSPRALWPSPWPGRTRP